MAGALSGVKVIELAGLVFHEADHVFFMFFGDTLHSLGGSVMQLLVPTVCMVAFLTRYHDPVGSRYRRSAKPAEHRIPSR